MEAKEDAIEKGMPRSPHKSKEERRVKVL